jgi:hypothetical protein
VKTSDGGEKSADSYVFHLLNPNPDGYKNDLCTRSGHIRIPRDQ